MSWSHHAIKQFRNLVSPIPSEPQKEEEQIYEIQVERERADNGVGTQLTVWQGQRHLL
jgi:hypothetical protein